jgi:hypothetical protein
LEVIGTLSFRFAETMSEIPHEYTERSQETEEAYVAPFEAIQAHQHVRALEGAQEALPLPRRRSEILGDDEPGLAQSGHQPNADRR